MILKNTVYHVRNIEDTAELYANKCLKMTDLFDLSFELTILTS